MTAAVDTTGPVVISTAPDGSPEWHAQRHAGIGGSDAATICGLNKYRTPYALWLEKVTAEPIPDDAGEAVRWGSLLEPVVRTEVARIEDIVIVDGAGTYAHSDRGWQHANVDGLTATGIYEGKTANVRLAHEWVDGAVPDRYLLQGMHYLAVMGPAFVGILYGCLIGGQELVIRHVARDDELIDHLITLETEFWGHVQSGEPPSPPDGADSTVDLVNHLWDATPDLVATVDRVTVDELIARRTAAKAVEDDAKADRQAVENELKTLLGDATEAVDQDGTLRYTWRPMKGRSTLDRKRLEADHPDLIGDYLTVSAATRRLDIKDIK